MRVKGMGSEGFLNRWHRVSPRGSIKLVVMFKYIEFKKRGCFKKGELKMHTHHPAMK